MNTRGYFESAIHPTQPYPWEPGREFGSMTSVTVPLNHLPATPGLSAGRSNRNVTSIGKWNRL